MSQREVLTYGEQISAEAWAAFEQWCKEYDPEGNMDTLDLAEAYDRFAVSPPIKPDDFRSKVR